MNDILRFDGGKPARPKLFAAVADGDEDRRPGKLVGLLDLWRVDEGGGMECLLSDQIDPWAVVEAAKRFAFKGHPVACNLVGADQTGYEFLRMPVAAKRRKT